LQKLYENMAEGRQCASRNIHRLLQCLVDGEARPQAMNREDAKNAKQKKKKPKIGSG
jgi:hypothetical protein